MWIWVVHERGGEERTQPAFCEPGESLLAALRRQGIYMPAWCAGRGTCLKCGIRVLHGSVPITEADRRAFSPEQLQSGMRLACRLIPDAADSIHAGNGESKEDPAYVIQLFADQEEDFFIPQERVTADKDLVRTEKGQTFAGKEQTFAGKEQAQAEKEQIPSGKVQAQAEKEQALIEKEQSPAGKGEASSGIGEVSHGEEQPQAALHTQRYGIAVDIGTTTISMELLEIPSGKLCAADSRVNHQRQYGTDVIARIQESLQGHAEELRRLICGDLYDGIHAMIAQAGISLRRICRIVIAANTTMCHLLMGYSCEGLSRAPFSSGHLDVLRTRAAEVLQPVLTDSEEIKWLSNVEFWILPGISAFVGADIVGGLLSCGFADREDSCMLIDLGTNGEMVIGNGKERLAASAAAGPAFEGGNISCGMASVNGAICRADILRGRLSCRTIGNRPAAGLCGTGALELTDQLYKNGILDETGLLADAYFEEGFQITKAPDGTWIRLTQDDVREIQMAKAAIRAGIEVLLVRSGLHARDLDTIYLAGGFGYALDASKAIGIGLLPEDFAGKVKAAGNTALSGAVLCLLDEAGLETAQRIAYGTQTVNLAEEQNFEELYREFMRFGPIPTCSG